MFLRRLAGAATFSLGTGTCGTGRSYFPNLLEISRMLSRPYVICYEGIDYTWQPIKSTPSTRPPVAELPAIIDFLGDVGVRSVCDFGAGRGRNTQLLANAFTSVVSVEEGSNVELLVNLAKQPGLAHCRAESWQGFCKSSRPLVDAALLCCVLHTLPDHALRLIVARAILRRLRKDSWVVLVSPRNDSRYRHAATNDAVRYGNGIVRLYRNPNTFSFYQTLSRADLLALMAEVGLTLQHTIYSRSRLILVYKATEARRR